MFKYRYLVRHLRNKFFRNSFRACIHTRPAIVWIATEVQMFQFADSIPGFCQQVEDRSLLLCC